MGHLDAHYMVPENPEFWNTEVNTYLEMSPDEQLAYWRTKRQLLSQPIDDGFDEYRVWVRYLGSKLGTINYESLVPAEILAEERQRMARALQNHDDSDAGWVIDD